MVSSGQAGPKHRTQCQDLVLDTLGPLSQPSLPQESRRVACLPLPLRL